MREFDTITALKAAFVSGEFVPTESVKIGEVVYDTGSTSSHQRFSDLVTENAKGVIVYEGPKGNNWLMFLWGAYKNNVIPYDVRTTTRPVFEAQDIQDRIIPDKVEVHFLNLPVGGSLIAKVDTGAEMCSLHAEQIDIDRDKRTVSFVAPALSRSRITANLTDQESVKTSGGETTYRPVITVTMKIKGKILKDIQVNLNDRSEMQDPMLVGQNALQPGNFLIDPNIIKEASELLTAEFLATLQQDTVVPPTTLTNETAQKLYEALDEVGDISIGDLIKLLRTQVLKNIDAVTY